MRDRTSDQHRRVAAVKAGRKLTPADIVHHVNENKADNRPANLDITVRGRHTAQHNRGRKVSKLRKALAMVKNKERLY